MMYPCNALFTARKCISGTKKLQYGKINLTETRVTLAASDAACRTGDLYFSPRQQTGRNLMNDIFTPGVGFTIISGGQTGADRAALDWAIRHGFSHDGWCPKGRKTEDGPLPAMYRLHETPSPAYLQRTEWNVRDSDATLIFTLTDRLDGGSRRTLEFAEKLGRPWLHFRPGVHPKFIARFNERHAVTRLNVAGKRESSAPGIAQFVSNALSAAVMIDASWPCDYAYQGASDVRQC